MRDFGPLHEFWTFLFERLNKVLKSYKLGDPFNKETQIGPVVSKLSKKAAEDQKKAAEEEKQWSKGSKSSAKK